MVPDQLRISDGWVRCGRCEEVFDGRAQLQTPPAHSDGPPPTGPQTGHLAATEKSPESAADVAESMVPAKTPDKTVTVSESKQGYDWSGVLDQGTSDTPANASEGVSASAGDSGNVPEVDVPTDPLLEISPGEKHGEIEPQTPSDFDIVPLAERETDQPGVPEPADAAPPPVRYVQSDVALVPAGDDSKFSFLSVNAAGQPDSSRSSFVLPVLAAALALLLGGQALVHERNLIATSFPSSRSMLETVCEGWGCTLEPLRRIESVVIDSSSFIKVRGDVFRLNFSLKNSGALEIAAPALELTLTDSQDETLARKILYPEQYLALSSPAKVLSSGLNVEATIPVQVKTPLNPQRVAGYRLLAFYP